MQANRYGAHGIVFDPGDEKRPPGDLVVVGERRDLAPEFWLRLEGLESAGFRHPVGVLPEQDLGLPEVSGAHSLLHDRHGNAPRMCSVPIS